VLIFRRTIVLVQHLVSALSLGDCSVHRLREDSHNLRSGGQLYESYSETKCRFAVKKSAKVSYKILLLSDSTFFKFFFPHIRRHY